MRLLFTSPATPAPHHLPNLLAQSPLETWAIDTATAATGLQEQGRY